MATEGETVHEAVGQMRIVTFGMMGGLGLFGVIALMIAPLSQKPDPVFGSVLLGAVGLLCVASAVGYRLVRRQVLSEVRNRSAELRALADPSEKVLLEYRRLLIVGAGMAEGPGFFALITYLLMGNPLALAVAVGALVVHALRLPSAEKIRAFAEEAIRGE